jgi:hypothetical protein
MTRNGWPSRECGPLSIRCRGKGLWVVEGGRLRRGVVAASAEGKEDINRKGTGRLGASMKGSRPRAQRLYLGVHTRAEVE